MDRRGRRQPRHAAPAICWLGRPRPPRSSDRVRANRRARAVKGNGACKAHVQEYTRCVSIKLTGIWPNGHEVPNTPGDIHGLSETWAPASAQGHFRREWKDAGVYSAWGRVAPQKSGGHGHMSGVAIRSHFPLRPCREPWEAGAWNSARVVDAIIDLGYGLSLLVLVIYGVQDNPAATELLLKAALDVYAASKVGLAILMGDLNLTSLGKSEAIQQAIEAGWVDCHQEIASREQREPAKNCQVSPTRLPTRRSYILASKLAAKCLRGAGLCIGMGIGMCIDMCMGMCIGM